MNGIGVHSGFLYANLTRIQANGYSADLCYAKATYRGVGLTMLMQTSAR